MFSVGDRIKKEVDVDFGESIAPGSLGTVSWSSPHSIKVCWDGPGHTYGVSFMYPQDIAEYNFSNLSKLIPAQAPIRSWTLAPLTPALTIHFQVGDRVRAKTDDTAPAGTLGTVATADPAHVTVDWDDTSYSYIMGDIDANIELVPGSNPEPPTQRSVSNGLTCTRCREFYPYAEPNQPDGTLKCYGCRQY